MTKPQTTTHPIRCAIYTRKSTEEGLDQEFNSLDAQRESAEAFIASQKNEGWVCLTTRYDDGGFTGGNMERPGLQRLLRDIKAGEIDCIVVYKVDRLSRSLMDFSRIIETFDKHGVSFVSVTQQFNTTSSMGRLTLNILLSFAQFEREIISERTRDKMSAARRRGKYIGGAPILGYDIDRSASRLVINNREATRVQKIFALYLEHQSLLATIAELDQLNWTTKRWTTKAGKQKGGKPFNKNTLHSLLTNFAYIGKVRYDNETYEGEHEAIIEAKLFEDVQRQLQINHRTGGAKVRNQYGALLKGLIHCTPCDCRMTHTHTTREGKKRYRYYVCQQAQKRGWHNCPTKSIPAGEIERFVIDQIRSIAREPELLVATLSQLQQQLEGQIGELQSERKALERELRQANSELRELITQPDEGSTSARQADLLERIQSREQRLQELREETEQLRGEQVSEKEVQAALLEFDQIWEALSTREQSRLITLLIDRVEYDGAAGSVAVEFRPSGFHALTAELNEEAA